MISTEKNVTAEDLKDKLINSLKSRGVLDSLKSQLRKQLIWELQDTTSLPVIRSGKAPNKAASGVSLCQRIANSIVADHLKSCNYEYTLSTFLPESGTSSDKVFADKDILHLLHINSESKLFKNLESSLSSPRDSKGFLWQFLVEIRALHNNSKRDAENQTEEILPIKNGSLEEKLSVVEKEFSEKLRLFQLDKNQGMEEKLLAVQRKYEMQKRKELQEEIRNFKAGEMTRLRLEERKKYEAEVKKIRQEYEQEFNLKHQALRAMEKEMMERLQRRQEVHESEAYAERQKILQEMQSFKQREADLKSRIELHQRSQKLDKERLNTEVGQLNSMEDALKEKEKFQEQRIKAEIERVKTEYEKQYAARQQELVRQESLLEAARSRLNSEREEYLKCQDSLAACREKNIHLQSLVETSRMMLENIEKQKSSMEEKLARMKDYEALKQKEILLKKDIEHLNRRLIETNAYCKELEKKQQKLVKELAGKASKPSKEVVTLKKDVKEMGERLKFQEKSNEARKNLESRLNMETQRANHFQKLYEDQMILQRLMETEIDDLKTLQQQTEQLLSMELRQRKADDSPMSVSSLKKTGARQLTRHEVLIRKYDTDESSAVDDNSLVSILEDKKKFEMLEREAEALDTSYRDFQNRMRVTQHHTIGSMPSSVSFHHLPYYHSFHSLENITSSRWIEPTVPRGEVAFRPQKVYNRSDISDRFKSLEMQGKRRYKSTEPSWINRQSFSDTDTDTELHLRQSAFPTGDSSKKSNPQIESENTTTEGDALSVKDLDTIPTSSPHIPTSSSNKVVRHFTQRSSSSDVGLPEVHNEKESEQISTHVVAPSKGRDEQSKQLVKRGNLGTESSANDIKRIFKDSSAQVIPYSVVPENHKTTSDAEDIVGNMALTSDVGSLDMELKLESEHLVDEAPHERLRTPSDKVKSRGSTTDHSEIQTFSKFQGPEELTLDGMWERREKKGSEDDNEDHHTNASLDMDELEERRRKDMKHGEVVVDYHTQSERGSEKSISVAEQERSDHDSGEPSLRSNKVELSRRWSKDDAVGDIEGGNQEHDKDPVIDPMMLKYMEMIRERRNNNPKDIEDNTNNHNGSKDVVPTEQYSYVFLGNEDDGLSVGKLSDEDFNWE